MIKSRSHQQSTWQFRVHFSQLSGHTKSIQHVLSLSEDGTLGFYFQVGPFLRWQVDKREDRKHKCDQEVKTPNKSQNVDDLNKGMLVNEEDSLYEDINFNILGL